MRILHYYRDFYEKGGVPANVRELVRHESLLLKDGVHVLCKRGLYRVSGGKSHRVSTRARAKSIMRNIDIVHITGCMIPDNVKIAVIAQWLNIPYIVSPTGGTLNPLLLKHGLWKRWKKNAWKPVERWILNQAVAVRCLSPEEEKWIKDYGIKTETFVVPVGIFDLPVGQVDRCFLERKYPNTKNKIKFVFLGRLDIAQKGLDLLIRALRLLPIRLLEGIHLFLIGPDWRGDEARLRKLVKQLSLEDYVTLTGPIYGMEKFSALASASAVVHPARWEEVPRAVREALSLGTPVLLTPQTNLGWLVEKYGAGVVVNPDTSEITEGISRLCHLLWNNRQVLKEGVKRLISGELRWDIIAKRMLEYYERLSTCARLC